MRCISKLLIVATHLAALTGGNAIADDKAEYERRSIENYVELFARLDRDRDGAVSRLEAQGNLDFTVVFDDIDINRDGIVTKDELDRFLGCGTAQAAVARPAYAINVEHACSGGAPHSE